ncbi:MAG: JAB domain-containing protein [Vitreoscilla sp.]|nr:JAB domain-containing protein [Vitreoscilla sp.]
MSLLKRFAAAVLSEPEPLPDMLPPINIGGGPQPLRLPSLRSETAQVTQASPEMRSLSLTAREQRQVDEAQALLRSRLSNAGGARPLGEHYEQFLYSKLVAHTREHFVVLYLTYQHELIDDEILFSGTIGQVPVFTREIIRHALLRNAAGVIVAHNHPTGRAQPSPADLDCTAAIKRALAAAGLEYVDNVIVAQEGTYSHARHHTL